jgi:hypothetical protein
MQEAKSDMATPLCPDNQTSHSSGSTIVIQQYNRDPTLCDLESLNVIPVTK